MLRLQYESLSATECYRSGRFDEVLLRALARSDDLLKVLLPTFREERQATYSPFLPISPKTGKVLQVPTLEYNVAAGTIVFDDPDGGRTEEFR